MVSGHLFDAVAKGMGMRTLVMWGTSLALTTLLVGSVVARSSAVVPQTDPIPQALLKMADTERAFARRATETTVRQAFIDYFADESIAFEPDPVPARESMKKRDTPQPAGFELHWEPRLGDIAASGDLGYLTGPAEYINPGKPNTYSCYFSVWKRQADGEYRVMLDVGISTPEKTPFVPGFVRSAATPSWKGKQSRAEAEASLMAADQALAGAIAARGASEAFRAVMHPSSRLNRRGLQPMTRDTAVAWLAKEVTAMTSEPMKVETAASGDLGYTWGKHTTKGPDATISSYYIRVWTRKADGTWQLVSDVTTPPPPSR
jgi:ketosteroid isomerase-like protein